MFGNYLLLLLIIFTLTFFNINTIIYIYKRFQENKTFLEKNNKNDDDDDISQYFDINEWLKNNNNNNLIERDLNDNDIELCKGMVIEIDNDKEDCNEVSKDLCDGKIMFKKITIPLYSNIDFYSHSGYKLNKGQSYCIYKPPPNLLSNNTDAKCDETWGFWQYSSKYERWQCKSKVPGIYNPIENKFNPCSKGKGQLFYQDDGYIANHTIPIKFNPEQFYSLDFQNKFQCVCPKGYISRPDISRTTCFKDPCLISLPPNAVADGYQKETGNCHCSPYFTNLYPDNPKSPCTTCPNGPSWDSNLNILTIYVKCGEKEKFPCLTVEDQIRGCIKATIKVKPILDKSKNTVFEDLIFF